MATLYITEYARLADDEPGRTIQAGQEPPVNEYTISITGSSQPSLTFHQSTRFVMIGTDAVCHIAFGDDPVASSANRRLPADSTVFYGVPNATQYKLAVIEGV